MSNKARNQTHKDGHANAAWFRANVEARRKARKLAMKQKRKNR